VNERAPALPPPAALDDLRVEPPFVEGLRAEPWRHDFYAALRRIERSFPERERIGDVAARRDEYVALGEQPYMDFPASTIAEADRDLQGRLRLFVKFLACSARKVRCRWRRPRRAITGSSFATTPSRASSTSSTTGSCSSSTGPGGFAACRAA
jgi:hypothetical protein